MSVIFVDTNILVYRFDETEPRKQRVAREWLDVVWKERSGRTSTQVLQELYVTLTRKVSKGLPPEEARRIVQSLEAWDPVRSEPSLIHEAWELESSFSLSFWDAMIVAAALQSRSSILLTEDMQHELQIESLTIVNPFLSTSPGEAIHDG